MHQVFTPTDIKGHKYSDLGTISEMRAHVTALNMNHTTQKFDPIHARQEDISSSESRNLRYYPFTELLIIQGTINTTGRGERVNNYQVAW